jgi:hypothetical protein
MSIAETLFARLATIGQQLKDEGHSLGEEILSLVGQLTSAEKPVVAEAEADAKQVGEDAVRAAEPVVEQAANKVAAAVAEPSHVAATTTATVAESPTA